MADVKAEIEITATDKASSEIEGVGKKSSKALKAVKKFGSVGATAFKGFTIAAVGINQALLSSVPQALPGFDGLA